MILGDVVDEQSGIEFLHDVATQTEAIEMITPYMYHYYIEALLKCGDKTEALSVMEKYWGRYGRLGADTFWELYNPNNRMNHLMVGLLLIVTVMPGVVRLLIFFENIILKNKSGVFV